MKFYRRICAKLKTIFFSDVLNLFTFRYHFFKLKYLKILSVYYTITGIVLLIELKKEIINRMIQFISLFEH